MTTKTIIIFLVAYSLIIISICYFAYTEGYYDGMKKLCPAGELYENMDGEIECLINYTHPGQNEYHPRHINIGSVP